MSDNIVILPICENRDAIGWHGHSITITPTIARQIVAEADMKIPSLDGKWVYSMRRNAWEPADDPEKAPSPVDAGVSTTAPGAREDAADTVDLKRASTDYQYAREQLIYAAVADEFIADSPFPLPPSDELARRLQRICRLACFVTNQDGNKALRADLAAERERRVKAEVERDNYKCVYDDYTKHTQRAQIALSTRGLGKNYLHAALDQLDEARAEVAALKARKVKLPPAFEIFVCRNQKFITVMEADPVIAAIRAAGVEVES